MLSLLLTVLFAADQAEYAKTYRVQTPTPEQAESLNRCLAVWGDEAPFSDATDQKVRVITTQVRVMGFGGSEPEDTIETDYPQLVLIEPAVNVVTKTTYELRNPNGWYCFETATTALAISTVNLHCEAHLASDDQGVAVIGTDETGTGDGGVVVLGQFEINKVGCD